MTKSDINDYRGLSNLVYAKIIEDTKDNYITGEVKPLAGISGLTLSINSSSEVKFYDNLPAITISSGGNDEITMQTSAIPFEVLADITGQDYDAELGVFIEGEREQNYFALGFIAEKTDGSKVYTWRYKGAFSVPNNEYITKDDGTDSNGQELVYTGISTTFSFAKYNKPEKAATIDTGAGYADVSTFFDEVTTPDMIELAEYTVTITEGLGTTLSVTKGGVPVTSGSTVNGGDKLTITVTDGTVTVNGKPFVSGGDYIVKSDVTILSTAI